VLSELYTLPKIYIIFVYMHLLNNFCTMGTNAFVIKAGCLTMCIVGLLNDITIPITVYLLLLLLLLATALLAYLLM
jgi:hypothetical protein